MLKIKACHIFITFIVLLTGSMNIFSQSETDKLVDSLLWRYESIANNESVKLLSSIQNLQRYSTEKRDTVGIATSYIVYADYFGKKNNTDSMLQYANRAFMLASDIKNSYLSGLALAKVAAAFEKRGRNAEASRYYLESIDLLESSEGKMGIYTIYLQTGELFQRIGNMVEAEKQLKKLYEKALESQDSMHAAHFAHTLSSFYLHQGKDEIASRFLGLSKVHNLYVKDKFLEGLIYATEGYFAEKQGDFKKAYEWFSNAYDGMKILNNTYFQINFLYKKGEMQYYMGNIAQAKVLFYEALTIMDSIEGDLTIKKGIYETLTKIYEAEEDFEKAYRTEKKLHAILDTLYNPQRIRNREILDREYRITKMDDQISLLKAENEIQAIQAEKLKQQREFSRLIFIFTATVMVLTIVILAIAYHGLNQKNKQQRALNREKELLRKKEIESLQKNTKINVMQALIEGEERERERISRELHDSIGGHLSALKIQIENNANCEDIHRSLLFTYDEVQRISKNLTPYSLRKFGFNQAVIDLVENNAVIYKENIDYQIIGNPHDLNSFNSLHLYRIVQEALTNALKYSQASEITVQIFYETGSIRLTIEDNGKGFNFEEINGNTGLGIPSIQQRAEYIGARVDFETSPGKGTLISVKLENA